MPDRFSGEPAKADDMITFDHIRGEVRVGHDPAREAEATDGMRRIGDQMQSEASRVAEWSRSVAHLAYMPYEVESALLGLESAIHQWTELRRKEAR